MKGKYFTEKILEFAFNSKPGDCRFLTVKYQAQKYGVSIPYLSALYKKNHDMNLKDILIGIKGMHGIHLLSKKKKLPIKEIAGILDFRSVHGFEKMFKRLYGITPFDYRFRVTVIDKIIRATQKRESEKLKNTRLPFPASKRQ
ncbi:MAG: helix-turn-helix domain-containing protein [Candidatus Aminicenantes bacterium]|nr:helix-turn-helix domain-containing protein [Candidatus Aminicenantes bacterium]